MEKVLPHFPLLQSLKLAHDDLKLQETYYFDSYEDYLEWYYRWTNNWHECNAFCWTFIALDAVVIFGHFLLNIKPLFYWAQGNLLLVLYTNYVYYMSAFALMLLVGSPGYMMAPKSTRVVVFSLSLMTTVSFLAGCVSVMWAWWSGMTPHKSLGALMELYILYEQLAAFVPSFFIVLFDGLAFSDYALFNPNYGKWDEVNIPGMDDQVDEWMGRDDSLL